MEQGTVYRQQQINEYKRVIEPLVPYLPWLEKSAGTSVSKNYSNSSSGQQVMAFPVYDATLLNFVRAAERTSLMDRNYRYIYTRNGIRSHEDERKAIQSAGINEWNILCGILSNYVLGGRTKGTLWSEGVQEQIFFLILSKMQEIIDYWDKSINVN